MRTFGRLVYEPEYHQWLFIELEPHVVIRLKDVFKRVSRAATGIIKLADGPDTCSDIDWFRSRYPLVMSKEDDKRLHLGRAAFEQSSKVVEQILLPDWTPPVYGGWKKVQPYPYQAQAIELTKRMRRLLLLDDVGLGKTISAIGVMLSDPDVLPAAVIVQSHLAEQWAEDVIEPYTGLRVHIIKGTRPYELPPADVYIFKYSNIACWADIAARGVFRSAFFDEIQELRRGHTTQKGIAARTFRDSVNVRMGLTATPIYNYGDEMFHVVEFIAPGALGSWDEFAREWCTALGNGKWKVRNPDALGSYLREAQIVLRRTEADVGGQMPPVNTVTHEIDFDQKVADEAADRARMLAIKVMTGTFVERGQAARELDGFARHTTGVAKARQVADYVRVLVKGGVPVVLAGWHREVYDRWLADLADLNPILYTGSETSRQKRKAKEAFVSGATDLLILSLRSGSGLDGLQFRGSTVVFGELDWSPMVHKQVIGRLRRPGQEKQVDAIYLWANGGADPVMIETLGVKASQSRGITDPHAGPERVHSDESRIKRLAERYLEERAA